MEAGRPLETVVKPCIATFLMGSSCTSGSSQRARELILPELTYLSECPTRDLRDTVCAAVCAAGMFAHEMEDYVQ